MSDTYVFRWTKDLKIDIYGGEEALELKAHGGILLHHWINCVFEAL